MAHVDISRDNFIADINNFKLLSMLMTSKRKWGWKTSFLAPHFPLHSNFPFFTVFNARRQKYIRECYMMGKKLYGCLRLCSQSVAGEKYAFFISSTLFFWLPLIFRINSLTKVLIMGVAGLLNFAWIFLNSTF